MYNDIFDSELNIILIIVNCCATVNCKK